MQPNTALSDAIPVAVVAAPQSTAAVRVVQLMSERGVLSRVIPMSSPERVSLSISIGEQDIIAAPSVVVLLLDETTGDFSRLWPAMSRHFVYEQNIVVFGLDLLAEPAMPSIVGGVISVADMGSIERAIDELCFCIAGVLSQQAELAVQSEQTHNAPQSSASKSDIFRCTLTDDSGRAVAEYAVTADVVALLQAAKALHTAYRAVQRNEPEVAFTSLLLALAVQPTRIGQWFESVVQQTGIAVDAALQSMNAGLELLSSARELSVATGDIQLWASMSVLFVFSEAEHLAASQPVDVRHLVAVCIYSKTGHEDKLASWGFQFAEWSNSFLRFIENYYPGEFEAYRELHSHVFSSPPESVAAEVVQEQTHSSVPLGGQPSPSGVPNGPSTHIASDCWTTDDALGYDAYAHAIYRFITHEKTKPPLTISIQAPWGGGKTSLMRMVQQRLDPKAIPAQSTQTTANSGRAESESNGNRLRIRDVLDEIKKWTEGQRKQEEVAMTEPHRKATVWFNAWKYESVNQVWSGLADAIMQQVAARMPRAEREKFWLKLHLRRIDAEKIRQKIHDRILNRVWQFTVKLLPIALAAFTLGAALVVGGIAAGWWLSGATVPASVAAFFVQYWRTKKAVDNEPADISLHEYVSAPNYSAELGFIHHAERDLQRVFECIPEQYKPLVVFIDDLDRCSPGNVAKVMEAVNLFLAGEFPNCIFVLGMDTELVAAALQAAHRDMVEALDNHAKVPVGWRFMDKFIQLPFIIPPCGLDGIDRYTSALFSARTQQAASTVTADLVSNSLSSASNTPSGTALDSSTRTNAKGVSVPAEALIQQQQQVVREHIDKGIKEFRDDNPEVQQLIEQGKRYFRGNPREMKRFANTFRFHYFLRWARDAQPGAESPSPEQVVRWTVLAMKWPEVARWLHSGFGAVSYAHAPVDSAMSAAEDRSGVRSRLQLMENCATADSAEQWEQHMAERLDGDKPYHWINDGELFRFFKHESELPEGQRLSVGAGKGLW